MNYLAITKDEMLQGSGLRVALWVSGCEQHCKGCHNAYSWDRNLGKKFGLEAILEIYKELDKDYIAGLSILGGNPTEEYNIETITILCKYVKKNYPNKNIWVYSGHTFEELKNFELLKYIDVLVDGKFIEELADIKYPYAGSTNQRLIDIPKTLKYGKIILINT